MSDDILTMLADAAAAFARPDAARVRALRGSPDGFDRATWQQMADFGWFSILVPEAQGGLGLGLAAAATIATRTGHAVFPEPFVASGAIAPWCLAQAGARAKGLLAKVGAGEIVATLAWQNREGALDTEHVGATLRQDGTVLRLDGECRFVVPASADLFLVAARGEHGVGLYSVARDRPGVSVRAEPCADGSASGWLTLAGVAIDDEHRLIDAPHGAAVLRTAVDLGPIATSAELVGLMDRMLELTLEYLRTRKQFGKAIGSFQALQHRAVDLWIHRQVARAVVDAAIRSFDAPESDAAARTLAASSAKARAAQSALLIANQSIQLHGAIGTTDEYDLGVCVNRALTLSAWMGNAAEHRRRFGALKAAAPRSEA